MKSLMKMGVERMNSNKGLDQADGLREEVQREAERLPSRSELHAQKHRKSSKTKWKLNFPFVRLIGILFLLIPITILAIHFNGKDSNVLSNLLSPPVKNVEPITMPAVTAAAESDEVNEVDPEEAQAEPDEDRASERDDNTSISDTDTNNKSSQQEAVATDTEAESPTKAEEEQASPEEVEEEAQQETAVEYIEHVVQESETLYRISMKYYGSRDGEKIISDHNNLVNGQVNVGQQLLIPTNR